jgi:hypothetical protein
MILKASLLDSDCDDSGQPRRSAGALTSFDHEDRVTVGASIIICYRRQGCTGVSSQMFKYRASKVYLCASSELNFSTSMSCSRAMFRKKQQRVEKTRIARPKGSDERIGLKS